MDSEKKNIFVVGLDGFNLDELRELRHADEYNFHALCNKEELQQAEGGSFNAILELCRTRLKEFSGSIDAVIAFWDFPAEAIAPILCKERGLPYTTIESLEKCEHKYWSRVAQQKIVPECVPDFCKVDPFDERAEANLDVAYPFWLKPVNSFSSYLGFRIENAQDFNNALTKIRGAIDAIAEPYNELLDKVSLPYDMQEVDGKYCVAEEIVSGDMFATCGFVHKSEVTVYGLVDVIRLENASTLSRLQYPTKMPQNVAERAVEATKKVMSFIEYDNAAFHIEFFYNAQEDKLSILEINPRISQSHGELFKQVDGDADHSVPVDLSLGLEPRLPSGQGNHKVAAKYYIRHDEDALVLNVPGKAEFARLAQEFPDARAHILVEKGKMLSDLVVQDSYSFELADLYIGAENEEELLAKIERCKEILSFDLRPADETAQKKRA